MLQGWDFCPPISIWSLTGASSTQWAKWEPNYSKLKLSNKPKHSFCQCPHMGTWQSGYELPSPFTDTLHMPSVIWNNGWLSMLITEVGPFLWIQHVHTMVLACLSCQVNLKVSDFWCFAWLSNDYVCPVNHQTSQENISFVGDFMKLSVLHCTVSMVDWWTWKDSGLIEASSQHLCGTTEENCQKLESR
jgi:hypothetical protein